MTKLYFKQSWVCLGIGALALTACVDNDYDVSNVDATVQIGQTNGKFSLPASSTGGIELKNLFSINDGSAVQEINGTYFINSDGKTDPSNIKIDEISISEPSIPAFQASLDLSLAAAGVKGMKKAPGDPVSYQYDISSYAKAEIQNAKATGISSDVISIDSVGIKETTFNLIVQIEGTNKDLIEQMHFSNMALRLPKGLAVKSCKYRGTEVLTSDDLRKIALENGVISFSGIGNTDYPIKGNTDPLKLEITLYGAQVNSLAAIQFDKNLHSAEMTGKFQLEGFASLSNEDFDQAAFVAKAQTAFQTKYATEPKALAAAVAKLNDGDYSEALSMLLPRLDFNGEGYFGGKFSDDPIVLNSFSGQVQHIINDINDVELNELPDFLTDDANTPEEEKVTLDLSNPQVFLKLDVSSKTNNVFNGSIQTGVKLEAYQDVKGSDPKIQKLTETINTGVLSFTGKDEKSYTILKRLYSNTEKATDVSELPSDYASFANSIEHESVPGLGTFLTKVPNTVKVKGNNSEKINVVVDCENLKLPQDIDINFEYKVFTALSFGSNFKVTYKEKSDGMSKDLKDMEDMNFGGLEITAKFYSDLPLPVKLDVKAYDIDGNEIKKGLKLPSVDIPANANGVARTLIFEPVAPYTFNDFIKGTNGAKKLDAIEYKVLLGGSGIEQGKSLKPSQTIRLDDIQISLIGGLKIMDNGKKK